MITRLRVIPTRDADGKPNGRLVPIWNSAYDSYDPKQVYVTSVAPKSVKGPHLHLRRQGAFTVLTGTVLIVTRENGEYRDRLCQASEPVTVHVPAGVPCAMYNVGNVEALILNMPCPAWRHDDQDEHPVDNWDYEDGNLWLERAMGWNEQTA